MLVNADGSAAHLFPVAGRRICQCGLDATISARDMKDGQECILYYCPECGAKRRDFVAEVRRGQYRERREVRLVDSSHWIGLVGEMWFAGQTGLAVNFINNQPDGGVDFLTRTGLKLDVKTTRRDRWTFRPRAATDIYVFLQWPEPPPGPLSVQYFGSTSRAYIEFVLWRDRIEGHPTTEISLNASGHPDHDALAMICGGKVPDDESFRNLLKLQSDEFNIASWESNPWEKCASCGLISWPSEMLHPDKMAWLAEQAESQGRDAAAILADWRESCRDVRLSLTAYKSHEHCPQCVEH